VQGEQVDEPSVDGFETEEQARRDREEGNDHHDHELGEERVSEGDGDERSDGQHGDGLDRDQPRERRPLQPTEAVQG
jgi:hypothetical protein